MEEDHLQLYKEEQLPMLSNGMRFSLMNDYGEVLFQQMFYSVGRGFILVEEEMQNKAIVSTYSLTFSFINAAELLEHFAQHCWSIVDLIHENEKSW